MSGAESSPSGMTDDEASTSAADLLATSGLEVEGVLTDASNVTVRVLLTDDTGMPLGQRALYKPIRGEAPLRDFPTGTLGKREVAAYLVSVAGGWDLIPPTVLRDGPLGAGSVQEWVDWESTGRAPGSGLLEIFPVAGLPDGWLTVMLGEDAEGTEMAVAHQDSADLASMAVLDLVLNNADRKGAHLVRDAAGHLWGFDHGLTFHTQDKLRTVLWGWAGRPLPEDEVTRLRRLREELLGSSAFTEGLTAADSLLVGGAAAGPLLTDEELQALRTRVERLLAEPLFPALPSGRYPLPWPLW